MTKQWHLIEKENPPVNTEFGGGYNEFDEGIYLCRWDGSNTSDDGTPFPTVAALNNDDYYIQYWMEKEVILSPNVKNYEEENS